MTIIRSHHLGAIALALTHLGCGPSPKYESKTPPQPTDTGPARPASEVALFLPSGSIKWTNFLGDFQVGLDESDLLNPSGAHLPAHTLRLGDLRTKDARLGEEDYRVLMCGWAYLYPQGCQTNDDDSTCPNCGGEKEKLASYELVQAQLAELRSRAAAIGATGIVDVRCYGYLDQHRLWCEGTAVTSR